MMQFKKRYALLGTAAVLSVSACNNLDVTNPNNPDIARALSSPADVKSLAQSTVRSWYMTSVAGGPAERSNAEPNPQNLGYVASDVGTMDCGNLGARFNNLEPRISYANLSSGGARA